MFGFIDRENKELFRVDIEGFCYSVYYIKSGSRFSIFYFRDVASINARGKADIILTHFPELTNSFQPLSKFLPDAHADYINLKQENSCRLYSTKNLTVFHFFRILLLMCSFFNTSLQEKLMIGINIGKIRTIYDVTYQVIWNDINGDVYVLWDGWIKAGNAPTPAEAMLTAEQWLSKLIMLYPCTPNTVCV